MKADTSTRTVVHRHGLVTRITHWINVVALVIMLMSGLQIFNAHPALYWGAYGANFDPHWLALKKFPGWITIPSWQDLATGRRWHLFFAWVFVVNGLVYLVNGFVTGHFRRHLLPTRAQWRGFGGSVRDHLRLKFPKGSEALEYNVLQKIAYLGVLVLLPLMLATGLTMSPAVDAAWPWLLDLFGGRQSARSLHFIFAWSIVGFVIVHLVALLAAGPINGVRSMITGRWVVEPEERP
jgi:thiosulfate reductase cytochrome b subunit